MPIPTEVRLSDVTEAVQPLVALLGTNRNSFFELSLRQGEIRVVVPYFHDEGLHPQGLKDAPPVVFGEDTADRSAEWVWDVAVKVVP